ncbi:MAG: hypothetical protein LH614_07270 [Pyrinomonadaceae bacterium]|nr:hypothetical protein [Pyrinomonadaceae bacterium]
MNKNSKIKAVERQINEGQISFKAFEVKIGIVCAEENLLRMIAFQLSEIFPNGFEPIETREIEYNFSIRARTSGALDLYRNEEKVLNGTSRENFPEALESQLRVTIAEFAVGKVFLHAGVIGWKGRAIVIPARSFAGKTTLVAALVRKGALYYSDEFAVLDAEGNVQPFPKMLSIRGIIDDYRQVNCPVESLGGIAGSQTLPVGMVLICEYDFKRNTEKNRKPEILSRGEGIMEILPHTLPLRNNPKFTLEVLNKLASRAIIVRIVRSEADSFAVWLLKYFESSVIHPSI